MIEKNLNIKISDLYRIRRDSKQSLIFCKKDFSIAKLTENAFLLFKMIDAKKTTVDEILKRYDETSAEEVFDYLGFLFEKGVIVYDDGGKRIRHVFDLKRNKLNIKSFPNFIWWDITTRCNLNCKYCYSSSGYVDPNELDTGKILNIIDELNDFGLFYIFFLGGEPLVKNDFSVILKHCKDIGIATMVTTNGMLVDEKWTKTLYDAGVSIIRVSMDSCSKKKHNFLRGNDKSYDRCISALNNLSKYPFYNIGLSTTIAPVNRHGISKLIKLAKKYNCNHIQINPVTAVGRAGDGKNTLNIGQLSKTSKLLNKLSKKEKKFIVDSPEGIIRKQNQILVYDEGEEADFMGCGAGVNCLAIQADGKLGYCVLFRNEIGNLNNEKFFDAWKRIQAISSKNSKCKKCPSNDICNGPCKMLGDTCNCDIESFIKEV